MSRLRLCAAAAAAAAVLAATACGSCTPGGGTPPPQPPQPPAAVVAAGELVEAGCLADDDSAVPSVQEFLASDATPPWLTCLVEGGSVASCGAPCSPADP